MQKKLFRKQLICCIDKVNIAYLIQALVNETSGIHQTTNKERGFDLIVAIRIKITRLIDLFQQDRRGKTRYFFGGKLALNCVREALLPFRQLQGTY